MSNHSYVPYSEEDFDNLNADAFLSHIRPIDPWEHVMPPNHYRRHASSARFSPEPPAHIVDVTVHNSKRKGSSVKVSTSWDSRSRHSGDHQSTAPLPRRRHSTEPYQQAYSRTQTNNTAGSDWPSTASPTVSRGYYTNDGPSYGDPPRRPSHSNSSTGQGHFVCPPHATYTLDENGEPVQNVEHMTPTFTGPHLEAGCHRDDRLIPKGSYEKRYFQPPGN